MATLPKPRALAEMLCTISMSPQTIYIDCDTREEADALFNWLEDQVGPDEPEVD